MVNYFYAILAFVFGASTACTPSGPSAIEGELRVQLGAEPVSLDPALAEDGVSLRVLNNTMEGLIGMDGQGRRVNRLAQSVEIKNGGKQIRFLLRTGVRWSDGRELRAQDFVDGMRRSLAPHTSSKLADLLLPIKGARNYRLGKSPNLPGVYVDSQTPLSVLVIELENPTPYFLDALSLPTAFPIRLDLPESKRSEVGVGPYFLSARVAGQEWTLVRNPNYWNQALLPEKRPKKVRMIIIEDESAGAALFEKGRIDILTRVPVFDRERFKSKGWWVTHPFWATYYLGMRRDRPPFNDVKVRRAVSAAIQRGELVEALGGDERPAWGWIPPGLEGFSESFEASLKARSERYRVSPLQKIKVDAEFDTSGRNRWVMEKIQHDLAAPLGIQLSLQNRDWKSYVKNLQADPPSLFRFAWLAPFADPISHLEVFVTGNPNNLVRFSNAKYDAWVREIAQLPVGPKRQRLIEKALELLLWDECVLIPIYYYTQTHAIQPRVKNFAVNALGVIRFDELSLD